MTRKSPLAAAFLAIAFALLSLQDALAQRSTAPGPYAITAVDITKFDKMSGEFKEKIGAREDRTYLNELDLSLFAVVEVSGKGEDYAPGRKIEVSVTEGKRVVLKTTVDIGVINQSGRYFAPVFLPGPYCSDVKINARILGQTKQSAMSRKISFACGE